MGEKKQNRKLTEADSVRRDEYEGKYKDPTKGKGVDWDKDNPVKHDPLMAKNLKTYGSTK